MIGKRLRVKRYFQVGEKTVEDIFDVTVLEKQIAAVLHVKNYGGEKFGAPADVYEYSYVCLLHNDDGSQEIITIDAEDLWSCDVLN